MTTVLYSYKESSEGAKQLTLALGIKRLKHNGSLFLGGPQHTVINWGATQLPPSVLSSNRLNPEHAVLTASNKLKFFQCCNAASQQFARIPPFTTSLEQAAEWITEGFTICCRTLLNGHSANGLVLATNLDKLVQAPLYTKYIKKKDEYRVHIAFGEVIDSQRKALRKTDDEGNPVDKSEIDFRIRNLANGFIYTRNGFEIPEDVKEQAMKAYQTSGLHFGAVDVIYNETEKKAYVLEINTAPGLCGQTVQSYAQAFKKELNI